MRDFRDAEVMASALRDALKARAVESTQAEALELVAKAFGYESWNVLSVKIEAAGPMARVLRDALEAETIAEPRELIARAFGYENWKILSAKIEATTPRPAYEHAPAGTLFCAFCGKSQHEVRKLIAGPTAFICNECVVLCVDIVEMDDDLELLRLMRASEESGAPTDPPLLDLARRMSTEELAHYVERGRKGAERTRVTLLEIERMLATQDGELPANDNALATARRELKRYEDVLNVATTALGERRQ
jgi:hypothetical protein